MRSSFGNRICVIANRFKTIFYDALVKRLEIPLDDVHWVCNGRPWLDFLLSAGYARDNILYYEVSDPYEVSDLSRLSWLETESQIPIWRLIQSDRLLSRRTSNPLGFADSFARRFEDFLLAGRVTVVFGECTWAPELLAWSVAKSVQVPYLSPHTVRIPSERFAFFFRSVPVGLCS